MFEIPQSWCKGKGKGKEKVDMKRTQAVIGSLNLESSSLQIKREANALRLKEEANAKMYKDSFHRHDKPANLPPGLEDIFPYSLSDMEELKLYPRPPGLFISDRDHFTKIEAHMEVSRGSLET